MTIYCRTIDITPVPASRPRVTRWSTYYSEPYNTYKDVIKKFIQDSVKNENTPLIEKYVPLELEVIFYLPMQKLSKVRTKELDNAYHVKKPDLDNLTKGIKDAMNGIIYHDDGQVSRSICEKRWSTFPRMYIKIKKIEDKIAWIK